MDRKSIHEVLDDVFGRSFVRQNNGDWILMTCPTARWTHEKGHDTRPSAGVSVKDNGTSIFNCFTCGRPRPFHAMLRDYAEYSGEDLDELIEELEEDEFLGPRSMPTFESLRGAEEDNAVLMPLDAMIYMDLYDSAAGHKYITRRGISDETANRLELKFDPKGPSDHEPRILFPVKGPDGSLYGFSGRAIRKTAKLKVRDYHGLPKSKCVLGSHLLTQDSVDKVLVVEGLFDYANGWECGFPTAAVMHSTMTEAQAEVLRDIGKPVYLFYDNDQAGRKGVKVAGALLADYVPVMTVKYPRIWIEDQSEEDGGHWLKDPGEMMPEEFDEMIAKAQMFSPV